MLKRNILMSIVFAIISVVVLAFVAPVKSNEEKNMLSMAVVKEKESRQFHFHNVPEGDAAPVDDKNPISCIILCHGNMPHAKNQVTRAMLNFHIPLIDCCTCHVKNIKGGLSGYRWFDGSKNSAAELKTGTRKVDPMVRIKPYVNQVISAFDEEITGRDNVPLMTPYIVDENGNLKMVTMRMDDTTLVKAFLAIRSHLGANEQGIWKGRFHSAVSNPGVDCTECHRVNSILPLKDLFYSEERIDQIVGTEAAGIIGKYSKFFIPNLPGIGSKKETK